MADLSFTAEEIRALNAYINDGGREESLASVMDKVFYAEGQLRKRLANEAVALQARLDRARKRIERFEERRDDALLRGEYADTGLDSVDVANCLLYYLQQKESWKLTRGKLLYILFLMYASWLASKGERLFVERPVASEYGPQFWRVFKHIPSTTNAVPYDAVKRVAEQNAGVAAFCQNAANKYYDYGESDLKAYICKCPAYKAALPEKNGGKWNGEMSDALIAEWKQNQNKNS